MQEFTQNTYVERRRGIGVQLEVSLDENKPLFLVVKTILLILLFLPLFNLFFLLLILIALGFV